MGSAAFAIIEALRGRYRLGVRTEDSQSSNPGSIPGSATKSSDYERSQEVPTAALMTPNPLALIAEVTHRCPLHCVYCSNPLELAAVSSELSADQWIDVFRQA